MSAEEETARIIALSEEKGDFVTGDDGYVVFWPARVNGAFDAWHLRALADELDRRNAGWDAYVQAHFRQ